MPGGRLPGLEGLLVERRAAHLAAPWPMGEGLVQLWQEHDPAQNAVDLVAMELGLFRGCPPDHHDASGEGLALPASFASSFPMPGPN